MRYLGSLGSSIGGRSRTAKLIELAALLAALSGLGGGVLVAQVPGPPQYPPAAGSAFSGYAAPGDAARSAPPAGSAFGAAAPSGGSAGYGGAAPSAAPVDSSLPTVRFFEENGVTYREDLRTGQRIALPPRSGTPRPVAPTTQPTPTAPQPAAAQPTAFAPQPTASVANTAYHSGTPTAYAPAPAATPNFVAPATVGGGFAPVVYPAPGAAPYTPAAPYAAAYPAPVAGYAPAAYPGGASPSAVGAAPAPSVPPGTPGRWTQVLVSDYQYSTRTIGRWNPFRTPVQVTERTPVLRYEWRFTPDATAANGATAVTAQRVIRY